MWSVTSENMKVEELNITNGFLIVVPNYLTQQQADSYFRSLQQDLNWEQSNITLFGKTHLTPRLEAFYAENNLSYSYSGKKLRVNEFNGLLRTLKSRIENDFNVEFNSVLANLYRNGADANGWHSDDERELGVNPVIASLSFGATRRFDLKHKFTGEKLSFQLAHGSLLIMAGETQHFWKHQLARSKAVHEARINLTYRKVFVKK